MRNSQIVKNMLKYVPVLSILVAIALDLLIGKDLYPTSLDSQSKQPLIVLPADGPCDSSNLYTSLPPKCKTLDGKFIPVPGTSSESFLTPEGK